jgi:hypothetical protein
MGTAACRAYPRAPCAAGRGALPARRRALPSTGAHRGAQAPAPTRARRGSASRIAEAICWPPGSHAAAVSAAAVPQSRGGPAAPAPPRPPPGLLAVPGLASPAALTSAWRSRWRPGVEARLSGLNLARAGSDDSGLLAAAAAALGALRDVAALAEHVAVRGGDEGWRSAAADVAAGCRKYEGARRNGGPEARGPRARQRRTCSWLRRAGPGACAAEAALTFGFGPSHCPCPRPLPGNACCRAAAFLAADRPLVRRLTAVQRRLEDTAPQQPRAREAPAAPQTKDAEAARLCAALLRALRRGAPAAAGAALDGGAWAAALEAPDAAQEALRGLQKEERELLGRLDALMGDPGGWVRG